MEKKWAPYMEAGRLEMEDNDIIQKYTVRTHKNTGKLEKHIKML